MTNTSYSVRVVHLTTVHHPYDPRIYHKELKSLQSAGFDVTLIAKESDTTSIETTIKHIPVKKYKNRLLRMVFGTYDAYKKAKKLNAKVYHFHDPELLPIGWLLKKKNNVVIYDIHEDYVTSILQKDYLKGPVKKLIAKLYRWTESFFTREMELCLAEKYYQDIYPTGKCILNYPTINENFLNHSHKNAPLEDRLLYTGNVSVVRGALIHAKIPLIDNRISVHFVGKCPKPLADEMYSIAEQQKKQLEFEGINQFVEKEVIEERYLSRNWLAGIALFPPTDHYRRKELTKFFEYMNAGLPILCSNFPVWKDFVEKYKCGIAVDPYNEEEIKDAIEYLRNNQDEAKRLGENGKKAVMEELNWKVEEKKLVAWYNQLLNRQEENMRKGMAE